MTTSTASDWCVEPSASGSGDTASSTTTVCREAKPGRRRVTFTVAGSVAAGTYAATVTGHEAGTTPVAAASTYYYEVQPVFPDGSLGNMCGQVSASTVAAHSAPVGLTATAAESEVTLTWTGVPGAVTYNIYRATTSGGEGSAPYDATSGCDTMAPYYTDTTVTNGTTFYYTVTEVDAAGETAQSTQASATRPAPHRARLRPRNACDRATGSIEVYYSELSDPR